MNTITQLWHTQRENVERAAMIDGWMTVAKRPTCYSWQVTRGGKTLKGIADTKEQAQDAAELAYAEMHKGE